jgi:hypothetical protein
VTYKCEGITQQHIARRMLRQLVRKLVQVRVYLIVHGSDLQCLFVDFVYSRAEVRAISLACVDIGSSYVCVCGRVCVYWCGYGSQMTAWASLAREVPSRNLRSLVLVSVDMV